MHFLIRCLLDSEGKSFIISTTAEEVETQRSEVTYPKSTARIGTLGCESSVSSLKACSLNHDFLSVNKQTNKLKQIVTQQCSEGKYGLLTKWYIHDLGVSNTPLHRQKVTNNK